MAAILADIFLNAFSWMKNDRITIQIFIEICSNESN